MEPFQLFHDFSETVLPAPAGGVAPEVALALPHGGWAACPPCDASSETPSVPPFLPRALPRGRYRWGAYANERDLFVIVETEEGPPVPALAEREEAIDQLIIFQPDGLWYRILQIGPEGRVEARSGSGHHSPRKAACAEPEWDWEARRIPLGPRRWRAWWRVALCSLEPHRRGHVLRVSLSRTSYRFHEGAAWGAYGIWGPRFDECGTLRFGEDLGAVEPQLKDLAFEYDDAAGTARFRFEWRRPYEPGAAVPNNPLEAHRESAWDYFILRAGGLVRRFSFAQEGFSAPFPLAEGVHEIHVATRGGTALRRNVEVRGGARLRVPPPEGDAPGPEAASRWVAAWLGRFIAKPPFPFARYESWMSRLGSAVALWLAAGRELEGGREWLERLADFMLSLQREDGTFSGFHLAREGRSAIPWQGGAYDSGPAGELWLRAHAATGRADLLEASRRLVRAYGGYRIEFNPNYAAFALYHLAPHYRLTGDPEALGHLEYYLRHCVLPNLLPTGFHGGHNAYTVYASIILRGLAMAAGALPPGHPLLPELLSRIRRMTNQTFARLQPDGSFDSLDRHFIGETIWLPGLFDVEAVLEGEEQSAYRQWLRAMLGKAMEAMPAGTDSAFSVTYARAASLAASPSVVGWIGRC